MNLSRNLYQREIYTFILILFFLSSKINSQAQLFSVEKESRLIDAEKQQFLGNYDKAIEQLEIIKNDPEIKAVVHFQLAKLYKRDQKYDKMLESIHISCVTDPSNKWYLIYEANLLDEFGRYEACAINYESLSKLEPLNYTYYDLAALNYIKANKTDKALKILDKAESKFGIMPNIAIRKSKIFMSTGKDKKAMSSLEEALKSYPTHKDLMAEIIPIYQKNGKDNEAAKWIKIIEIDKAKDNEQSLDRSSTRVNSPLDVQIKEIIKLLKNNTSNDFSSIQAKAIDLSKDYPSDNKVWALIGDVYFLSEEYEKAIFNYKKAIQLNRVSYEVYENILFAEKLLNKWNSLEKSANEVLEIYPNVGFPFLCLAESQMQQGQWAEAKASNAQALLIERLSGPNRSAILIQKAKILNALNEKEESEEIWKSISAAKMGDYINAEIQIHLCNLGEKLETSLLTDLKKSQQLSPYQIQYYLSSLYLCTKDFENAKVEIMKGLNLKSGQTPELNFLAFQIYLQAGMRDQAKTYLKTAIDLSEYKNQYQQYLNSLN